MAAELLPALLQAQLLARIFTCGPCLWAHGARRLKVGWLDVQLVDRSSLACGASRVLLLTIVDQPTEAKTGRVCTQRREAASVPVQAAQYLQVGMLGVSRHRSRVAAKASYWVPDCFNLESSNLIPKT